MGEGKMRKKFSNVCKHRPLVFSGSPLKRLKEEDVDKHEGRFFSKILKHFDSFGLETV